MSQVLNIKLFGTPSVLLNHVPIHFTYKRAEALLYYMVCEQRASRQQVADILWPDTDSSSALKGLRHALYTLKKDLSFDIFIPDKNSNLEIRKDICVISDLHDYADGKIYDYCNGTFLEHFYLKKSNEFEQWKNVQDSVWRKNKHSSLLKLAKQEFYRANYSKTEQICLECISIEPLDEDTAYLLMQLYFKTKIYHKAVDIYQVLKKNLFNELGVSPMKKTSDLYYKIINEWNTNIVEFTDSSEKLIGREWILNRMISACTEKIVPFEINRFLLISGESGIGKTYLLKFFAKLPVLKNSLILTSNCFLSLLNSPMSVWNSVMITISSFLHTKKIYVPEKCLITVGSLFPVFFNNDYNPSSEKNSRNKQSIQDCILMILSIISQTYPIILLIDDIQWIDSESLQLLNYMIHNIREKNISIIITSRTVTQPDVGTFIENALKDHVITQITLRNFSENEAKTFLNQRLLKQLSNEEFLSAYNNSHGNPLSLLHYVNLEENNQNISSNNDKNKLFDYRLSCISIISKEVLDIIATFPDYAPLEILQIIISKDLIELLSICKDLENRDFIKENRNGEKISFMITNNLLHEFIINTQTEVSKRILHLKIANAFEQNTLEISDTLYTKISYHYQKGGNKFLAFKYGVKNLIKLSELHFELIPIVCTTLTDFPNTTEDLSEEIINLEHLLDELKKSKAYLKYLCDIQKYEAILLNAKSRYYIYTGNYKRGLNSIYQLLDNKYATQNKCLLIVAHRQMAYYAIQISDTKLMNEHIKKGLSIAINQQSNIDIAVFHRLQGLQYLLKGEFSTARKILMTAKSEFISLNNNNCTYNNHIAAIYDYLAECNRIEENFKDAIDDYNHAIYYNTCNSFSPVSAMIYTDYCNCAFQMNNLFTAKEMLDKALSIYHKNNQWSGRATALAYKSFFLCVEHNYDNAYDTFLEALQTAQQIQSPLQKGQVYYISSKIEKICPTSIELGVYFKNNTLKQRCISAISCLSPLKRNHEVNELLSLIE